MLRNCNSPLLDIAVQRLATAGIVLHVTKKPVKNINFRLKPYQLMVSVPISISTTKIAQAIDKRLLWALKHHPQVLAQYQRKMPLSHSLITDIPVRLWGIAQPFTLHKSELMVYYRQQLNMVIPPLFDKWQPIVGVTADEVRIKKMHSRWGSCNTLARRIWLSVYLPAYPIECTEYVIVHELCHLHHPNHSRAFWQTVESAMPEYQQWHDILAGNSAIID